MYRIKRTSDGLYSCKDRYSFSTNGDLFSKREVEWHLLFNDKKYYQESDSLTGYVLEELVVTMDRYLNLDFKTCTIISLPDTNV